MAVYSTAERDALHVAMADQAVCIGPPAAAESYLRIPNVVAAAETTGCEAIHPGFGFLSENPAFVRACAESDLVFVGPPAEVMEKTGDKARAKAEMRAAGVPLVPGTEGVASLAEIRAAAAELGYPVLLKAIGGRRRQGDARRHVAGRARGRLSARRAPRPRPRSATARSTSRRRSCPPGMSRSRCSATATAACSRSASASARSSGATRS